MEWVARGLGFFYLLGGLMGLRAARMNSLLDQALAGIELKPTPGPEKVRAAALWIGAGLTAASGAALLLLFKGSAWLFAANLVAQAAYLIYASRRLKPTTPEEVQGRNRTRNAAIGWGLATLAVIWWTREGLLTFPEGWP